MIKKAVLAVAALVVLPTVLWVTDPGGYITAMVRHNKWEPSLDFEISRAKSLLDKLDGDVKGHREAAAEQQARVDILQRNLERATSERKAERERLVALRNKLKNVEQPVSVDDRTARALDRQLKDVQFKERIYTSVSKQHESAKKRMVAMEDALSHLKGYREEAKQTLESLEAELAAARAEQIHGRYAIDDSQFSKIKELLDKIELGVKKQQNLVNMEKGVDDEPVQPAVSTEDVLNRVDAYLDQKEVPQVAGK